MLLDTSYIPTTVAGLPRAKKTEHLVLHLLYLQPSPSTLSLIRPAYRSSSVSTVASNGSRLALLPLKRSSLPYWAGYNHFGRFLRWALSGWITLNKLWIYREIRSVHCHIGRYSRGRVLCGRCILALYWRGNCFDYSHLAGEVKMHVGGALKRYFRSKCKANAYFCVYLWRIGMDYIERYCEAWWWKFD